MTLGTTLVTHLWLSSWLQEVGNGRHPVVEGGCSEDADAIETAADKGLGPGRRPDMTATWYSAILIENYAIGPPLPLFDLVD